MNGRQKISIAATIAMAVLILVTAISSSNYLILIAYLFGLTSADNLSWLIGRFTQKSSAEKSPISSALGRVQTLNPLDKCVFVGTASKNTVVQRLRLIQQQKTQHQANQQKTPHTEGFAVFGSTLRIRKGYRLQSRQSCVQV